MIDDELLRKVLNQKIINIKEYPRSVQKKVESEMATKYNVKYGDVVDIFNGISPNSIEELDYNMLYKFMKSIYEVAINSDQRIDASDLNADKYFTASEKMEFDIPYPEEEKDSDLIITDWKQINQYLYEIYTNIDEVIQWRNLNKLRFNPETQRDLIPTIINGKKINKLDINRDSIKNMKSLMKKNMYYNPPGTINVNPDLFPEYLPYKDGKNLIIPKEAHMDLIEGFHNYVAETELKDENPDWEYDIRFDLRLMNIVECNLFITQMNEKNKFKPSQIVRINKLSEINYIIDSLNRSTDFHLYGTINDDMKVFLNKFLTNLYGNITEREISLELLSEIEKGLNVFIKFTKHFNKPLVKKEWFAFVNIIKFISDNKLNLNNIVDVISIKDIIEHLKHFQEPTPKNIRDFKKYINEVIKK